MESNDAGEDMWLRAEIANEKLKHDAQTHGADGMQAMSVLYMTQLEAMTQQ